MSRLFKLIAKVVLVGALGAVVAFIAVKLLVTREGVVVPDLTGKDVVAALEIANKLGLDLKISDRAFNPAAPINQVISQEPRPGSWVKSDGIIRVVVSKGLGETAVPSVLGQPWRKAKDTLERYGIRIGELVRIHSDQVTRDSVIAQSPSAEAKIHKGGTITLLVSEGPWPVSYVMPDLRGQPQSTANEVVTSIGLRVEKISYIDRPDVPAGSVVEHRPISGQRVAAGAGVSLVLAKRETTPLGNVGTFALFQHRLPKGTGQRRVQVVIANAEERRQVFDEMRAAGTEVRLLVKVHGNTVARVYYDGVLVEEKRIE